ncbi:Uma2 family endonuclease, partial [Sphaerospermopsis aphanizomenoides BCCUSP55]|uniref:Uma2 family endonuclease n=1 Tax=Sphaerospermopsis aphanizomenoides TaxID=459663 RepID=UPI001908BA3F
MTTTLEKNIEPNNHLVLTGISWEKFEQIQTTFQGIEGIRFIYLDGDLEIIMNLGKEHEYYKRTISLLLEAYFREKGIRFYTGGSATLGNKNITGQKEPDESYTIQTKKDIPDLIIEVIFTSGSIEILEIYKRIGIPEVWFWEDGLLTIYT